MNPASGQGNTYTPQLVSPNHEYLRLPHLTEDQKTEAAAISNEIYNMKVRLEQLEAFRAKVQHSVDSAKVRLGSLCNHSNPTNCLPTEVLSHIMEDTCSGSPDPLLGSRPVRMEVYLSHVCRRWRDVAISTPTLWTKIEGPENQGRLGTMRTEAYLIRSRNRLIDVSFLITVDYLGRPRANWGQDFLETTVRHSKRWRSFIIRLPEAYDESTEGGEIVDALVDIAVPQLESVDFSVNLPNPDIYPFDPYIFCQGAPKLSRLRLSATTFHWFAAPMTTITTLTLHSEGADFSSVELFHYPNLRHLSITRKKGYEYLPIEFIPPFEHLQYDDEKAATTRLVSLRLPIYDLPLFCKIPPCLHPALESLQYLYLFDPDHFDESDDDSDSDDPYVRPDSEWCEWPDRLQELFDDDEFDPDLFPSLEHLSIDLGSTKPSSSISASSLCRLTKNISTLTLIHGCLAPDTIGGDGEVAWPRLGNVRFQTLPEGVEECRKLVALMAERGRRFDGTFSVALPARQVERLERSRNLEKEVQEMKATVCLEKTSVMHGDTWPPKDNAL